MPAGVEELQSSYRCWIAVICLSECRRNGASGQDQCALSEIQDSWRPTPILPLPLAALLAKTRLVALMPRMLPPLGNSEHQIILFSNVCYVCFPPNLQNKASI
jgi:hypothetical protein